MLSYLEEKKLEDLCKKILPIFDNIKSDFENITEIIQNKSFIKSNKDLLSIIGIQLNAYQIRIFLSIIMIKYCPDEILQYRYELDEKLIFNASQLLDNYIILLQNPKIENNFKEEVINFIKLFEIWKEQDKTKFLFVLSSSYNELIITTKILQSNFYETEEEKERAKIWISEIEKQKKTLEKSVYQIGGDNAVEKMLDGSFWLDVITPQFREMIDSNLKKSFRSKLIDEINSSKTPFILIKCLKEVKDYLENKNKDLNKELKIELLNNNLCKEDCIKIVSHNIKIFLKEINLNYNFETNAENLVDNLLLVYEKIGK